MRVSVPTPFARRYRLAPAVTMVCLVLLCVFVFCVTPAYAGPGGQFVKVLFKSKLAGILFGVLCLVLLVVVLPLWLYITIRERLGIRRTRRDLEALAERYPEYEWERLRKRTRSMVKKIHAAWGLGRLDTVQQYLAPTYYATQQQTLSRWEAEGKRNVCKLRKIRRIEPLAVSVRTPTEAAWVRVLVSVDLIDYLRDEQSQEILKGSTEEEVAHETIWVLGYDGEQWVLVAIEEGDGTLVWASHRNHVDTTLTDIMQARARSQGSSDA